MRFVRKKRQEVPDVDLTPMIDMTFNLIAFFMIVMNFSDAERSDEINLPTSALAKPPDEIFDYKIILNLDRDGSVVLDGQRIANIDLLNPLFNREITAAQRMGKKPDQITVIIRGHEDVETGQLQRLMAKCQENSLQIFHLRVKEKK
jgi:biopolymer transport protein ExbD